IRVDGESGVLDVVSPADWRERAPAQLDLANNARGMGRELFSLFRLNACSAVHGGTALPDYDPASLSSAAKRPNPARKQRRSSRHGLQRSREASHKSAANLPGGFEIMLRYRLLACAALAAFGAVSVAAAPPAEAQTRRVTAAQPLQRAVTF